MGIKNALNVLLFPIGLLFGYFFYYSTLRRFHLDPDGGTLGLLIILTATATLFSLSVHFRCISCLTVPTFLARNFRSILITLIITELIIGPFDNISGNVSSSASSIICFAKLKANQSVIKYNFLYEPSLKVVRALIAEQANVRRQISGVIKERKKFEQEFIDQSETADLLQKLKSDPVSRAKLEAMEERHKEYRRQQGERRQDENVSKNWRQEGRAVPGNVSEENFNYHLKNDARCLNTKRLLVKDCKSTLRSERLACIEANQENDEDQLACEKDENICDEWNNEDEDDVNCEEMAPLDEDHVTDYHTLKNGTDKIDADAKVTVSINATAVRENVNIIVSEEYKDAIQKIFLKKSLWIKAFLYIIDYILIAIFVIIFVSAINYNKRYRNNPSHDNIYITEYFRKIDMRRRLRYKMTLIPFKKLDKCQVVDVYSLRLMPDEKKKIKVSLLIMAIALLIVLIVIYVDYVLCQLLISFKRHGSINYHQHGWRYDEYIVKGNGSMSVKIRAILDEMSGETSMTKMTTSDPCLPNPKVTSEDTYNNITIYFVIWLILALSEAYLLRTRRLICSYFYRKREKSRALFLYNQTLRTRKRMLKYKIDRALKEKEIENQLINSGIGFDGKEMMKRSPNQCRLCSENPNEKVECTSCGMIYCHQCWDALKRRCLDCNSTHAYESFFASNIRDDDQVTKFAQTVNK